MRTLLNIELYELTGNEVGKIREQYRYDRYFFEKYLPTYCVNSDFGNITESDGYLQFVDSGDEKYLTFYADTVDKLLGEEVSNCSLSNLFKNYNMLEILKPFRRLKHDDLHRSLPSAEYLVIDIIYSGGQNGYLDDFDIDLTVVGALVGPKLNLIEYEWTTIQKKQKT